MDFYFSYKAEERLGKLPFDMQERIRDKVRFFMKQDNIFVYVKHVAVEKCYRFRVGNYRVKFIIKDNMAKIISIKPRDKAY